jgi:hypothetical protein
MKEKISRQRLKLKGESINVKGRKERKVKRQ